MTTNAVHHCHAPACTPPAAACSTTPTPDIPNGSSDAPRPSEATCRRLNQQARRHRGGCRSLNSDAKRLTGFDRKRLERHALVRLRGVDILRTGGCVSYTLERG
jgi:hypothetical protein